MSAPSIPNHVGALPQQAIYPDGINTEQQCEKASAQNIRSARMSRFKAIALGTVAPLACAGFVFAVFAAAKLFAFTIAVGLVISALYPPIFLAVVVGASHLIVKVTKAIWGKFVSQIKGNWQQAKEHYAKAQEFQNRTKW